MRHALCLMHSDVPPCHLVVTTLDNTALCCGRSDMKDALLQEEKKLRRLRFVVDLAQAVLMQSDLTLREAFDLVRDTKKAALILFPDKEQVFDLVYGPRFRRIISERFVVRGGLSKKNRS